MLREHRGQYFVEYHCASRFCPFALLNLIFPHGLPEAQGIQATMESELQAWLKRYPVPIMAHAIDSKEDTVELSTERHGSTLMGFVDTTGKISAKWGLFKDSEIPTEQLQEKYQDAHYGDVKFRWSDEIRRAARADTQKKVRAAKTIVFFLVVVPVFIQIVALRIDQLGYVLSGISILVGLFHCAKTFGYIKPNSYDRAKAEEERLMRHHHYHCKLNPRGFERLRAENIEREAKARTQKEDAELRMVHRRQ